MYILLLNKKCEVCGVKLTKFEIEEKDSYCMECYKDEKVKTKVKSLRIYG